jgi:rare lipoprotein A (peptidoglycan hydrolase)
VSPALAQRQIALAAVAVLSVAAALALGTLLGNEAEGPERAASGGGDWYTALAAPYAFEDGVAKTACGVAVGAKTMGVAHPVLPCGAKITLSYAGTEVLTQVIDRGAGVPGREFDVTAPLATELGLRGVQPIRWRFAPS